MSQDLSGKTALVTGGSRGIGRAIATALGKHGALVAVHYGRSADAADEVVKEIEAAGGKAFTISADLSRPAGPETLFAEFDRELQERTGTHHFDILVNNAGVAHFATIADTTREDFDDMFAVNVSASFFVAQEAIKRLNDGGRIVNFSSIVARLPVASGIGYSMTKGAVDSLTQALAQELGPREITVNAVAPGVIETDMAAGIIEGRGRDGVMDGQALKRIGQTDDIADVVAFLASPDARWITGQVIEASGGSMVAR